MRTTRIVAFTCLAACALPAQRRTAHPQESLQFAGASYAPFGVSPFFGAYGEGRTQLLIPAAELPGPGAILTGIETITSTISSGVSFSTLQISVAPTSTTSLSMTFATNLGAGATVVLPATGFSTTWIPTTGAWQGWSFSNTYVHDGTSALVIDIGKVTGLCSCLLSTTVNSFPARSDRPAMIHAVAPIGSGASTATTATASEPAIGVRLRWQDAPTLRLLSDAAAPGANQFALGEDFSLTLQGDPGQLWILAGGSGFLPTPVPLAGLDGFLHLSGPVLSTFGLVSAAGEAVTTFTIPSLPTLVGLYVTWQGAAWDAGNGRFHLTNGVDHFVNA